MSRILLSLALLAAVAQARSLEIDDFKVDIAVSADGHVTVTETLRVAFTGSWNGIYRYVPYVYTYPSGLRATLHLDVDAITDERGSDLWHETSREGGNLRLKIAVPRAKDAKRTVVIRYRSRNAIRLYDEDDEGYGKHDELYWNVTGNGWDFPIHRASATVALPPGVPAEEVRTTAYTGPYGTRGTAYRTERLADGRLHFETTAPLGANEGLTVVVGFPVGHVRHPTWREEARWLLEANWGALLPLAVALAWFVAWWFRGRDPIAGATIIPEFEPPFGLRPSQVGVLADEVVQERDVSACIVDLAVRGHLDIDMRKKRPAFRRKKPHDPTPLLPYEQKILDGLFEEGETEGSAKSDRLGKGMDGIREAIYEDVAKGGYFWIRPDHVRTVSGCSGALALLAAAVGGFIWATWWVTLLALVAAAIVVTRCSRFMPRRSRRGLEALRRIRGMEDYLETAEKERLSSMPRDHFEKLLPYAVALNVHDRWTEVFESLFREPPAWFQGRPNDDFSTGTNRFLRSTHEATHYTPPRSSSGGWSGGSGFSGGGSSGGGSGGGGGGGW